MFQLITPNKILMIPYVQFRVFYLLRELNL